ncbi:MAG: hypothetical protein QXD62_00035 [Candidatus Woesearchaeota archaeon]
MGPFTSFIVYDLILGFLLPFIILYVLLFNSVDTIKGLSKKHKKIIVLILIAFTMLLNLGFKQKFYEAITLLGCAILIFFIIFGSISALNARLNLKTITGKAIVLTVLYFFLDYFVYIFFGKLLTMMILESIAEFFNFLEFVNPFFIGTIIIIVIAILIIKKEYPNLFKK